LPRQSEPTERTCIVTRQPKPVGELIRFVGAPDGTLVPDLRHKLPGRGVWVTASAALVETAEKRRLFEKQFEGKVAVEPGLAGHVDGLLLAAAAGALALARKAGTLIGGFGKVESALHGEPVVALVHATGAGDDGVAKLAAAARRRFGDRKLSVIRCFTGNELDLAFGRTNVIHAALLAGPASDNVLARVGDLVGYRGDDGLLDGAGAAAFDALTELNDLSAGS
jgi:hypothetical protein